MVLPICLGTEIHLQSFFVHTVRLFCPGAERFIASRGIYLLFFCGSSCIIGWLTILAPIRSKASKHSSFYVGSKTAPNGRLIFENIKSG